MRYINIFGGIKIVIIMSKGAYRPDVVSEHFWAHEYSRVETFFDVHSYYSWA